MKKKRKSWPKKSIISRRYFDWVHLEMLGQIKNGERFNALWKTTKRRYLRENFHRHARGKKCVDFTIYRSISTKDSKNLETSLHVSNKAHDLWSLKVDYIKKTPWFHYKGYHDICSEASFKKNIVSKHRWLSHLQIQVKTQPWEIARMDQQYSESALASMDWNSLVIKWLKNIF